MQVTVSSLKGNKLKLPALISANRDLEAAGKQPAEYEMQMMGITKASLSN